MSISTWAEYHATQDTTYTADAECGNAECKFVGVAITDVEYTSIYPQIFCGECNQQILKICRNGKWETIEDASTYFGKLS